MNAKPRVVIVGAGFGGLKAARALRFSDARVTVIDKSNHHLFQPLLYQVATAGLSPADIAAPIRGVLHQQKNTEVLMGEVTGVDVRAKTVKLTDREVPYDYLVLATGARHSYFGHEEWEKLAPGLKSIDDATNIRRRILLAFEAAEMERDEEKRRALLNFIIVGGGPTGVELAGSIAELSHVALAADFRHIDPKLARVILIEAGPRLLGSFHETLSEKAKIELESLGVEVRLGARVEKITAEGVTARLPNGEEHIPSRAVIWAAGVKASPAAKWLGVEADPAGRVKVNDDLSVDGFENVFVIGDTALAMGENGKPLPGVAPVAMQEGHFVGKLIARKIKGDLASRKFRYVDKGNLATIGRSSAIAEIGRVRLSGFIAWMTWLAVHIFYLIGFRNRLLVLLEWAWAYVTFQRGARLITSDEKGRLT